MATTTKSKKFETNTLIWATTRKQNNRNEITYKPLCKGIDKRFKSAEENQKRRKYTVRGTINSRIQFEVQLGMKIN